MIVLVLNVVYLMVWVLIKSIWTSPILQSFFPRLRLIANDPELQGGFALVSKILFFVTLITAFLELQPFILSYALKDEHPCVAVLINGKLGTCLGSLLKTSNLSFV